MTLSETLTAPLLIAATVLCAAGASKLRSPAPAVHAFAALGLPANTVLVRAAAACELALGAWCAIDPWRPVAVAVACLYAVFAGAAAVLTRRRSSCGCFGEDDSPASLWQSMTSAALAALALAALLSGAHGLGWVLARPASDAAVILIGTAGAAYAAVLAYTELPQAWASWSTQ
jgi:hypothetical protein